MKSAPGALPGSAPGKSRSGGVNFLNVLDVIIILAYFVGMIVLGLIANKKQTGVDDYYLGGRSMGALKIGALWMAGWIGGSSVIGTSSNSYSMGITGVWYVGEIAIGCVLFALVMAKPIKRVSDELRNVTFPELIHARYDQKNSTMASITTILAMIGYTAAQFVAGASILNVLTGWNLGVCYILAAVVIVFYVSTGGLLAVTYTDIVQMALLLLGIVVLAVPLVGSQLHKMGANLVTDLPASFFDLGAWGWPTILALGLSTIMSFFTSMDSYTRCIAARDARTARTGTIYAAVLVLIIAGTSTFLGMAGKLILPDLSSSNNVIARGRALPARAQGPRAHRRAQRHHVHGGHFRPDRFGQPDEGYLPALHQPQRIGQDAAACGLRRVPVRGRARRDLRLVHAGHHEHPAHHVHHQLGRPVSADARRVLLEEVVLGGRIRVHALGDGHRRRLVHRRQGQLAAAVFHRRALAQLRRVGHPVRRYLPDAPPDPGGAGNGGEILRGEVSRKAPIPR